MNRPLTARRLLALPALVTCALAIAPAHAQETDDDLDDVFALYASSTTAYDSNLFHLPSTTDAETALGQDNRADWVEALTVGLHLDKHYWQQQLVGDASFAHNWHKNFDFLDASATNFNLSLNSHLTPRIATTLSANRREVPADFDFYRNVQQRNYHKQQEYRLRLDGNPFGGWHLIGGGGAYLASNTAQQSDTPKSKQYYADAGIGYVTNAGSKIQAIGRHAEGNYARSNSDTFAAARDFKENSGELQFVSDPKLPVSLKLNVGYLSRKHDDFSARDYQGWTADSSIAWQVSDKVTLSGRARRALSPYQDQYFTDYSRAEYTFTPTWQISPKVALDGTIGISRYHFGGYSNSGTDASRTDLVGIYGAEATWTPIRLLSVKAEVSNRVRDSSFDVTNFDYKSVTSSLTLVLYY